MFLHRCQFCGHQSPSLFSRLKLYWHRKQYRIHELESQVHKLEYSILVNNKESALLRHESQQLKDEIEVLKANYRDEIRQLQEQMTPLQQKVEYYEDSRLNPLYARVPDRMIDEVDWEAMGINPPSRGQGK